MNKQKDIQLQKHSLNVEKSSEVYKRCMEYIEKKKCYTNIYYVLNKLEDEFEEKGWLIAYGYISDFENIRMRHCYILDENNNVIDPTYIHTQGEPREETPTYYTFAELEKKQYLILLKKYKYKPDFLKHYKDIHHTLVNEGLKQRPFIAYIDY